MRILIIRLSSIGDIILTQPVVAKVRETFPEAEIWYLTKERYRTLPEHLGCAVTVLPYQESLTFFLKLAHNKFDLCLDLHNKFATWLIRQFLWRTHCLIYDKRRRLREAIVAHRTTQGISSTLSLYASVLPKLARLYQIPQISLKPEEYPRLVVSDDAQNDNQAGLLFPEGKKILALFPGAQHPTKCYPIEQYTDVIRLCPENWYVWLLGGPADIRLTRELHAALPERSLDLGGRFSLQELIYVINQANAVLSNDSGPMHIAAALGKPQLALFGSTHPRLGFAPQNAKARIICKDLDCQPCSLHGRTRCPQGHFACMRSIAPEEVVAALKTLLEDSK